jgi:EAL and modified HD-GYP domain-containing signal transduction protein
MVVSSRTAIDLVGRERLLALLGLLARDAETRELEMLLKQDPALSYHLLKLVDSAAFTQGAPITSFSRTISLPGGASCGAGWLLLMRASRNTACPTRCCSSPAARRAHGSAVS